MITSTHVHTMYSSLDGMSTPEEVAQRCVEIDCPCCAITDHGHIAGHLHFAKAMKAAGIKPILGAELYCGTKTTFKGKERDQAHLIALAVTDEGLRNLWRLVNATAREDHFRWVGRVFKEDLEKYHKGIVFTSACALGLVPQGLIKGDTSWLNFYLDLLGDDFYIELNTYPGDKDFKDRDLDGEPVNMRLINEALVAVGTERGCKFILGDDGHYAFPSQYPMHDLYIALQTKQSIYTPIEERTMWHPENAVVMKDEQMARESLWYLPKSVVDEAIVNGNELGERANASLPEVRRHLPMFVPGDCPWLESDSKALSAEELFIDLVAAGIRRRYGQEPAESVWERALYEMEILIRDGIHHYFLMGWDEIEYCRNNDIEVGPGRGSSAGCIVAYALGITDVDPLHYGLIFERFWNSGRADGFPDIDSDFPRSRRQDVISYLRERWGQEKVCAIGTVGRMKPKATVDKLYKGCGITDDEADELKRILDKVHDIEIHGHEQIGWSRELEPGKIIYVNDDVGDEIDKWIGSSEIRETFIDMCEHTCSRVEQYGIHASGIVISDVPLQDQLPAYLRGPKESRVAATLFPMDDVDKRQFIKLDVLGLRTLDTLEHWRLMMKDEGINVVWSGLDLKEHPDEMWDLLHEGFAAGIFQVEQGYPKRLCELMNARSVLDLSVITALIRPGPQRAGIPDEYIARRNGIVPVNYLHPRLEALIAPVLNETYGLFVYQEQIINYFNALGYTLSESDAMRKIMGKKMPEVLAALHDGDGEWKNRGYMEMTHKAGIPEEPAEKTWKEIEGFASYCFNKSHAVAYGIMGFRTLFAKYYGPAQFDAACIRTVDGEKRKEMLPMYINEARRLGINVWPPDIEYSQTLASVQNVSDLYFGFADVKGVGSLEKGAQSAQYLTMLRDMGLDLSSREAFEIELEALNEAFLKDKKVQVQGGTWIGNMKSPKQSLGAGKIAAIAQAGAWERIKPSGITLTDRQKNEEEVLGVILSDNTAEVLDANAEAIARCDDWDELLRPFDDKAMECDDIVEYFEYEVCGIVSGVSEKRSKKSGKSFGIVTIEYGRHSVEFMVWNTKWKSHKFLFRMRTPGIFTLRHNPAGDYQEGYSFHGGIKLK